MHKFYYKCLQGCFWMMYSASFGYLTYYLEELNFSESLVGIITAGFGLLCILLQPLIGRLADDPKRGWKKLLIPMITGILIAAVVQLLCPVDAVTGLVAGFVTLLEGSMLPLVNQACFSCSEKGKEPEFGVARGIGSLTYAIVSVVLGRFTAGFGCPAIPIAQIIISCLMLFSAFMLPCVMHEEERKEKRKKEAFFKKYPKILPVFIGLNFIMLFHCTTTTYIVKITDRVGGDSGAMGIALAIAAVAEIPVMFSFGWIRKKIKGNDLLVLAGFFFCVKGLFYLFAQSLWMLYIGQCFQMLSFAVYANAIVFYANANVAEEDATTGQAYMSITSQIGTVAGSLLGGFVLDLAGSEAMCWICMVFAVLGTIILGLDALKNKKERVHG